MNEQGSITVERFGGDRIHLTGWAGPSTAAKCKAVGGGRFRPKEKSPTRKPLWDFPLTLATCRAFRAQFGDALVIGPELNRWAKQAIAERGDLATLALADDATLVRVPEEAPAMDQAMSERRYQRVAALWGAKAGSFLLADQQGLGKSIETLATILEAGRVSDATQWHLVLAPLVAVESVWSAEVQKWLHDTGVMVVPLVGSLPARAKVLDNLDVPPEAQHVFVVINIESARIKPAYDEVKDPDHKKPKYLAENAALRQLHERVWDTVVVDECQRALIRTTGKMSHTRAGFTLLSKNSERRIALSGTPMRGKPEQLWGTLNWLCPDVYTSYWSWIDRYFKRTSNGFSNYILDGFQSDGEQRLANDLSEIMLRRTKAEVLKELPPKTYAGSHLDPTDETTPHGVWLDLLPAQRKQIADLERNGYLEFAGGDEIEVQGSLAEYTRDKQLANAVHEVKGGVLTPTTESPKYEWLLNWLEEADGEKIVVASQFTAVIDVWAAGLREVGYKVSVLTGKTPMGKRAAMVEQFQTTDEVQVFMLNTKAGGVAITLDAADYLVLIDETTIPDDQEQVEDRIHRTSRIHNVTIYYLRALGSIDEEISWIAAARANIQSYLLDGSRGVETAKRLFYSQKERNA